MRKYQQTQILEFIKTLYEATAEIKRFLSCKDGNSVMQLLADCQTMAVQIGNYIEKLEGEGTRTVSCLEEYCELLYQSNMEIGNNNFNAKIDKPLKKQLIKIENIIQEEFKPDKLEIAFFPYKASMWDSLESIWLAAKEDPKCDSYVVPIPHYDILPDGSLGQMHYEGTQYPDYVPVVDWRSYNVPERHPDIIFIHYAYDDNVSNASIHPDFYSKKLREYCDLLVYVPYFITGEDPIVDYCASLPGVLYSNHVIVESETVRQSYIGHYKKFEQKFGCKGQFGKPEEKFAALGSPKFDKVLNTKQENCDVPPEWKRLIYNSDGSRKKVILYNTHMFAWLTGGEAYFKKLRYVFDLFSNRDDAVLLWRPHPNTELNFRTKRPQWLNAYYSLINDYKHGVGIYDDTPDLNRALAVSDAYFGDRSSSLVALYEKTGKPMMFQNADLESYDTEIRDELRHTDAVSFGFEIISIDECKQKYPEYYEYTLPYRNASQNKYLAVSDFEYGNSANWNAVYKFDQEEGTAKLLGDYSNQEKLAWRYHSPIRIGKKLIFRPNLARRWAFYNIETAKWRYEDVPEALAPSTEYRPTFSGGLIVYGEDIIFFPGESGAFAKYNLATEKITYFTDWYASLKRYIKNVDYGLLCGAMYYKDRLLVASQQAGIILALDPTTLSVVKTYRVGNYEWGFRAAYIIPNTDTIYLMKLQAPATKSIKETWEGTLVKWNIETGKTVEYCDLPITQTEEHTQNTLNSFIFWKGNLYITPLQGNSVLKLDYKNNKISKLSLTPEFDFFERKNEHGPLTKSLSFPYVFFNPKQLRYSAQFPCDYSFADIDFESGEITNKRNLYFENLKSLQVDRSQGFANAFNETIYFSLKDYVEQVVSGTILGNYSSSKVPDAPIVDNKSGQRIHDYVKSCLGIK